MEQTTLSVYFKDNELQLETTHLSRRMRRRSEGLMDFTLWSLQLFHLPAAPVLMSLSHWSWPCRTTPITDTSGCRKVAGAYRVLTSALQQRQGRARNFRLQGLCVSSLFNIQKLYLSKLGRHCKMTIMAMLIETVQNATTTLTATKKKQRDIIGNFSLPIISSLYTSSSCAPTCNLRLEQLGLVLPCASFFTLLSWQLRQTTVLMALAPRVWHLIELTEGTVGWHQPGLVLMRSWQGGRRPLVVKHEKITPGILRPFPTASVAVCTQPWKASRRSNPLDDVLCLLVPCSGILTYFCVLLAWLSSACEWPWWICLTLTAFAPNHCPRQMALAIFPGLVPWTQLFLSACSAHHIVVRHLVAVW